MLSVQDLSNNVMCITLGAPASSRGSPSASPLFWNFLAVEDVVNHSDSEGHESEAEEYEQLSHGSRSAAERYLLKDLWPAVMTTIAHAAEFGGPREWKGAVNALFKVVQNQKSQGPNTADQQDQQLQQALADFKQSTGASCTACNCSWCCAQFNTVLWVHHATPELVNLNKS